MKKLILFAALTLSFFSCEKDKFDVGNPDVEQFVYQIKTGTYSCYEKGESGEDLWLLMPDFTERHIQSLIDFANDTTHITAYPFNPISSRTPYPYGRNYAILGECLLWTVEGIRNGYKFGSLDPYMIDTSRIESERYKGLNGIEILIVREIYKNWWNTYNKTDWKYKNPLEKTTYIWF